MHQAHRDNSSCVYVPKRQSEAAARGVLWKKVLTNFTTFTGKHPCQSVFFKRIFLKIVYPSWNSNLENKGSLQLN